MNNVYYNPEEFGLEIVTQADWSDGYYQFDYFVVWADENHNLYFGEDAGCSCPTPFESYTSISDLQPATFADVWKRVGEIVNYYDDGGRAHKAVQLLDTLQRWKRGLEQR